MTTVYLVRHGETDLNSSGIVQGTSNSHLSMKGVNKVKNLRQTIIDLGVDICYTSPLFRALETAFGLVGDKALIINDDRLIDRDMGNFEGKNKELFDLEKYWDYNLNCTEEKVEGVQDIFKRSQEFLEEILKKNKDKKILIVTHNANVKAIHHILRKTDLNSNLVFTVPNCYFEKIDLD
jgi:probable phosphoglycerate mutase